MTDSEYDAIRRLRARERAGPKPPPNHFPCPECPARFPSAAARDRHAEMRHPAPPNERSPRLRGLRMLLTGRD